MVLSFNGFSNDFYLFISKNRRAFNYFRNQKYKFTMAFVYQASRWGNGHKNQQPGPGAYSNSVKNHLKGGLISPDTKTHRTRCNKIEELTRHSDKENLQISQELIRKEPIKNQSQNKMARRVMSAKPGYFKRQFSENVPILKTNGQNVFFEITNANNTLKKQFENNRIKTLFKKSKKSIHSNENSFQKKGLFCDKNMRTYQWQGVQKSHQLKQNVKFLSKIFNQQPKTNPNLINFLQSSKKSQNIFFSNETKFNFDSDKQDFLIASQNCKIYKTKFGQSHNSFKENKSDKKCQQFEDMQSTGIEDSLDSSFQYIQDTTPGPGYYNLRKQATSQATKIEKFGITEKRFKDQLRNEKILNLNLKIPDYRKQSKASQEKVAFGKSRPGTAKQAQINSIFYENHCTIQKSSIQNLIQDRQKPGTFLSRCDRFIGKIKKDYHGPDFFEKDKAQEIQLPNSIFMSQIQRHALPLGPTAQVDYQGQSYKTIQKKIQKIQQNNQLIGGPVAGFYVTAPRFKYKERQENSEGINTKQDKKKNNCKQLKAFTFRKQDAGKQNNFLSKPDPGSYQTKMKWVKTSHHVRYKM